MFQLFKRKNMTWYFGIFWDFQNHGKVNFFMFWIFCNLLFFSSFFMDSFWLISKLLRILLKATKVLTNTEHQRWPKGLRAKGKKSLCLRLKPFAEARSWPAGKTYQGVQLVAQRWWLIYRPGKNHFLWALKLWEWRFVWKNA